MRVLMSTTVPTVAAKALTFTAQRAQQDIVAAMPGAFKGGATRYTLGATRIVPASVDKLSARVAVKDRTGNKGTLPEDYLFPQVYGGPRKEKRFERAMRYAGLLAPGMSVVLGRDAPANLVDSYGNLRYGEMQRILTATKSNFDPAQNKTGSAKSRKNARSAPYFAGGLDRISMRGGEMVRQRGAMQPGIYRRTGVGKEIVPVLVFVTKRPSYSQRLDFEDIARTAAQRDFEPIFMRLLRAAEARIT